MTFIQQKFAADCAVACLAMFLGVEYEDILRHVDGHELTLGGLTRYRATYIARLFEVEIFFLDRGPCMPILRNPRHEKFAQLVASGMTTQAAFTQAEYPSPQNAPRLRNNKLVAKKIEELQARNERKAEMAALSRDELIGILTEIVHATRARLAEARPTD